MERTKEQVQHIRAEAENTADPSLDLAVERTELALERTHLSWVRTVIGLIVAGFAIDKGLGVLEKAPMAYGEKLMNHGHAAGMVLTTSGTLLMVLATIFYVKRSRELAQMKGARKPFLAPDVILSVVIILIGTLLIYLVSLSKA